MPLRKPSCVSGDGYCLFCVQNRGSGDCLVGEPDPSNCDLMSDPFCGGGLVAADRLPSWP